MASNMLAATLDPTQQLSNTHRKCVYLRGRIGITDVRVNLNDTIGLEPDSDYTIAEWLEDQAAYEGRRVTSIADGVFQFDDGTEERLEEAVEPLAMTALISLAAAATFREQPEA